jgi:hypothetical protein
MKAFLREMNDRMRVPTLYMKEMKVDERPQDPQQRLTADVRLSHPGTSPPWAYPFCRATIAGMTLL